MAEDRDEPVVGVRVERDRPGADVDHEAVEPLVQEAPGVRERREVPNGALEEVGARVLDAGRLGARDRVPADEARVVDGAQQLALGRAHVGHERVRPGGIKRGAHLFGQRAHGRAGEAEIRAREGLLERPGRVADRSQLEGPPQPGRIAAEAHDLGVLDVLPGGEADRAADQPDAEDCDPHPDLDLRELLARQLGHRLELAQIRLELVRQ